MPRRKQVYKPRRNYKCLFKPQLPQAEKDAAAPPTEPKLTHTAVAQRAFKDLGQSGYLVDYSADNSTLDAGLPLGMVALLHMHILIILGRLRTKVDYDKVLGIILR